MLEHQCSYPNDLAGVQDQSEMIFRLSPEGIVLNANPAGSYYYGKTPVEMTGVNLFSDRLAFFRTIWEKVVSNLSPQEPFFEDEHECQAGGNEIGWWRLKYRGVFDHQGILQSVQVVIQDVTVEKKYQQALLNTNQMVTEQAGRLETMEQALQQESSKCQRVEQEYRELFENANDIVYVHDLDGRLLRVNKVWQQLMAYNIDQHANPSIYDLLTPPYQELMRNKLQSGKFSKGSIRHEIEVLTGDNRILQIEVNVHIKYKEGKPYAVYGIGRDVSERKMVEKALRESETNFRCLAETAAALIFVVQDDQLMYVNAAFCETTGFTCEEVLTTNAWEFLHPDCRPRVQETARARQRGEEVPSRYQARILRKDGQELWADFSVSKIEFNGEPAMLGVAIDITDRKTSEEKIRFLSFHDRLTGLYNRTFVEEKIKQLDDDRHLPISLIVGDLNGLKIVNDAFGHQQGDRLLRALADILRSSCRQEDIIARWGGDEFLIMLPCTDEALALRVCERITQACSKLEGFPVQVSIALGLSSKKKAGESIEKVFKEAEDRMYRTKLLESRSYRSSFLFSLEKTMRIRNHETQEHTQRLRDMVLELGRSLELPATDIQNLTLLAALHDIGKIAIPNSILDKPEKLTEEEWELMKKHTEIGYRIALSSPEMMPIAEGILAHHERWDGGGYPLGLRGEKIPLISRIIALADAYDVMISGRPYQKAMSVNQALKEIKRCAGTQFDPRLAKLFIDMISRKESCKPFKGEPGIPEPTAAVSPFPSERRRRRSTQKRA